MGEREIRRGGEEYLPSKQKYRKDKQKIDFIHFDLLLLVIILVKLLLRFGCLYNFIVLFCSVSLVLFYNFP